MKAILIMALVFISLALMQIWWGGDEEVPVATPEEPQTSTVQLTQGNQQVVLGAQTPLSPDDLASLLQDHIKALAGTDVGERRTAAIRLAYMTNDAVAREDLLEVNKDLLARLRQSLLTGLNDPDDVVSANCRDALIGFWRIPTSMAATQHFLEGLAAYEAGQRDNALEKFDNLEKAWRILPPDLYRLKAEILLPQSPDRAAEECRRALKAEPQHFLAHYVLAMAYRQKGDYENALKELNEALATYKRFPQAERMRRELLAQREKTPS